MLMNVEKVLPLALYMIIFLQHAVQAAAGMK